MSDKSVDSGYLKSGIRKKKRWTETEKRNLLSALKKFGAQNISNLKTVLPDRSENEIAQMIRKYRSIADLGKKKVNSPLDVWLRSGFFDEGNHLLTQSLLFIYLFEDQPPPEECAGFDLKSAYKFLYEASKRQVMTNLPTKTAEMIKDLIITVDEEVWPAYEVSITEYLVNKLNTSVGAEKTYVKKQNKS
ncbi:uncharacterized protein LOC106640292 [Copidosoma floridanum]|uniref:uncharacterized protein LOC106640292 n=1 Tax=Copidosoma floridanum TaxID=29053 RepID=UPI0006C9DB57|nr:uncharacterized protein LOC106640292 [Copidosoma floridanum]